MITNINWCSRFVFVSGLKRSVAANSSGPATENGSRCLACFRTVALISAQNSQSQATESTSNLHLRTILLSWKLLIQPRAAWMPSKVSSRELSTDFWLSAISALRAVASRRAPTLHLRFHTSRGPTAPRTAQLSRPLICKTGPRSGPAETP